MAMWSMRPVVCGSSIRPVSATSASAWKDASSSRAAINRRTTPGPRRVLLDGALRVERCLDGARQIGRAALAPVVQEHGPRLLVRHVLMDRDDVDAAAAHRLQHRLQLVLAHR